MLLVSQCAVKLSCTLKVTVQKVLTPVTVFKTVQVNAVLVSTVNHIARHKLVLISSMYR